VILKGGCNFVIETDRNPAGTLENKKDVEVYLTISLFKLHCEKDPKSNQITSQNTGKV
jgi:hypothetical protein